MDERERDVEPALHAAGVRADQAIGGVGEPELVEQRVDALPRAPTAREPEHLALQAQVLAPGRLDVGAAALRDDADRLADLDRVAEHVVAHHERGARSRGATGW